MNIRFVSVDEFESSQQIGPSERWVDGYRLTREGRHEVIEQCLVDAEVASGKIGGFAPQSQQPGMSVLARSLRVGVVGRLFGLDPASWAPRSNAFWAV